MKAKLVGGKLLFFINNIIYHQDKVISNPTPEVLLEAGFKDVVYTTEPAYDKYTYKLKEVYSEGETTIGVSYELVALTPEEHNSIVYLVIRSIEMEATPRNLRCASLGDAVSIAKLQDIENRIEVERSKLIPLGD